MATTIIYPFGPSGGPAPMEIQNVVVSVDGTSGNPSVVASLDGGVLNIAFTGLVGAQGQDGNPGMSNPEIHIVTALPNPSAATLDQVYYVENQTTGEYDRYITQYDGTTYSWFQMGSTRIDLSDYRRKDDDIWLTQEEFDALEVKDATKTYHTYEEQ